MVKKYLNKFYDLIDKIGKRNFILITFVLFFLIVSGLYATFSIYTSSDGLSILDGIKTYKFILSSTNTENSVTIAAGASKHIAITVSNPEELALRYGIYYSSSDDLTNLDIGYLKTTEYLPVGVISANSDYVVTLKIYNNSSSNITIRFGYLYGFEDGGDLIFGEGQNKLEPFLEADYYYSDSSEKYISMDGTLEDFDITPITYDYTGASQTFESPRDGMYKLEAWGASGGDFNEYLGGHGAYTSGVLNLNKDEKLYVYVGGAGSKSDTGGYNGGSSLKTGESAYGASGGGATDFRLVSGSWNDTSSLYSRIMVSAGGGGANNRNAADSTYKYGAGNGGAGGALTGISGTSVDYQTSGSITTYNLHDIGTGGTQTSGGKTIRYYASGVVHSETVCGRFGDANPESVGVQSGGGSGYYGGGAGSHGGAGGGSSYISGYQGCVAITSSTDVTPKSGCTDGTTDVTCSYHYSGKIFGNTRMIAGNAEMSTHDGVGTMIGNFGNGYAKVTPVVPTIIAPDLVVLQGNQLDSSAITCIDNGSGCEIVEMSHKDTTTLLPGEYTLRIVLKDNLDVTYQYTRKLTVMDNTEITALAEVHPGSYVKYIGNNGCSGASCSGQNANYVDDNNMGWCYISDNKFNYNGWRIAYVNDGNAYLISAGSPECMCTNSDGTTSNSSCSTYESMSSDVVYHTDNLNNKVLNYCNGAFVSNNICNSSSVWIFNYDDFNVITSSEINNCLNFPENTSCGYQNPLTDVGSYYWIGNSFLHIDSNYYTYLWYPHQLNYGSSFVGGAPSSAALGVRPLMKLDTSVIVTGGSGTYEDPYIIENPDTIKDLSGNMNNGVYNGDSWDKENGTLTTDGESSYVDCGLVNHDFGNEVSFVLRLNMKEITNKTEYFLLGNWESAGVGLSLYNGQVIFTVHTSTNGYSSFGTNYTLNIDTWYTLVGTYDGTNLNVYVNGEKISWNSSNSVPAWSTNANTNSGNVSTSKMSVTINTNLDSSSTETTRGNAEAIYSHALIFTRALTASEIASDYAGEVSPTNTSDLLLRYNFKKYDDVQAEGEYIVNYDSNGGTLLNGNPDADYSKTYQYGISSTLDVTPFKKSSDIEITYDNSYPEEEDECFIDENGDFQCTIGGSLDSTDVTKNYATYKLLGWSKTVDGSVVYGDGDTILIDKYLTDNQLTLYAVWDDAPSITLSSLPTKTGYTANGWYTSDGTRVGGAGDTYYPSSSVTLHVEWTENS